MKQPLDIELGKVAEVTFWSRAAKIAATTLGKTAGDAVTMSMDLGHLVGTVICTPVLIIALAAHWESAASEAPPSCWWR